MRHVELVWIYYVDLSIRYLNDRLYSVAIILFALNTLQL